MGGVTVWMWDVEGMAPEFTHALHVGHALRAALLECHMHLGHGPFPDEFHHSNDHGHAHYFSEDVDGDGLIDRLTLYAARGVPPSVIAAAAAVRRVEFGGGAFQISAAAMGPSVLSPLAWEARVWRSLTPFVTSRERASKSGKVAERKKYAPEQQLQGDLSGRDLPHAEVTWETHGWDGDSLVTAAAFANAGAARSRDRPPPPDAVGAFATLEFAEVVPGPIALGYGAHFGLGLFAPL